MTKPHLDQACLKFLEEYLDSLEKLEVLRHVRVKQVASRADLEAVRPLDDDMLRMVIRELVGCELLEEGPDGSGALRLGPLARDPTIETIMSIYELDRVVVLSALSSIAMARIRNMAARTFADAFVLKRRRKDEDG